MTTNENKMEPQRLERIETSVNHLVNRVTSLEEKVTSLDGKATSLDEKVTSLEQRLEAQGRRFDVQMESLREDIKTFAENLGGRLDAISAQITNKQQTTDARFADDEAVLRDHGRRIAALERQPRRRT
jgi:peptidoglycan hydrolase CwlO-like protein